MRMMLLRVGIILRRNISSSYMMSFRRVNPGVMLTLQPLTDPYPCEG